MTPHFLVSEFGTGSNYSNAGTAPDIPVNFAAGDDAITMAMGYPWHLNATSSSHLCLAVELDTPDDPLVPPSLLGRAPGWPTTDLLVVNDNNKAQRNMGVGPTIASGWMTRFAIVHNAATFRRDIVLRYAVVGRHETSKLDRIELIGGRRSALVPEGVTVLKDVLPGENRWVGLTLASAKDRSDSLVVFEEVVEGVAVNGFAVQVSPVTADEGACHVLDRCASVFGRLGAATNDDEWRHVSAKARDLFESKAGAKQHVAFLIGVQALTAAAVGSMVKRLNGDPFRLRSSLKSLVAVIRGRDNAARQSAHGAVLERLDASLTMWLKSLGDVADIAQNARWQADLFASPTLSGIRGARVQQAACEAFDTGIAERRVTTDGYGALIDGLVPVLRAAASKLSNNELSAAVGALDARADATTLQREHREVLVLLDGLVARG